MRPGVSDEIQFKISVILNVLPESVKESSLEPVGKLMVSQSSGWGKNLQFLKQSED